MGSAPSHVGGCPYCPVMDNIDWWGLIWESIGSALAMWAKVIAENPSPWLAILVIGLLGLLVPARRRRRRS
jgi:MYXO-CTERM domain-containing protein